MVNAVKAQGLPHQSLIDGGSAIPAHAGYIPHPAQQTIGDARRAATGGRNAAAGLWREGHPNQSCSAQHDRFQVVLAVKLQPLNQAETVPQRGAQRSGAGGGPVGLETLAAALGDDPVTLETVVEPFLLQQGLLMRTPRGRMVTDAARSHLAAAA